MRTTFEQLILIGFLMVLCHTSYGQSERMKLDLQTFDKYIRNHIWLLEDTTRKHDYEYFMVGFQHDTVSFTYANWLESISGSFGKFKLRFQNNIAELKVKRWISAIDQKVITSMPATLTLYCYLKNETTLMFLIRDKAPEKEEDLLKDDQWFPLKLTEY